MLGMCLKCDNWSACHINPNVKSQWDRESSVWERLLNDMYIQRAIHELKPFYWTYYDESRFLGGGRSKRGAPKYWFLKNNVQTDVGTDIRKMILTDRSVTHRSVSGMFRLNLQIYVIPVTYDFQTFLQSPISEKIQPLKFPQSLSLCF